MYTHFSDTKMRNRGNYMLYASILVLVYVLMISPKGHGQGGMFEGYLCLQTLEEVPGCFQDVIHSVVNLEITILGPNCCKAVLDIDRDCWRQFFPLIHDLTIPLSLRTYCNVTSNSPQLQELPLPLSNSPDTINSTALTQNKH